MAADKMAADKMAADKMADKITQMAAEKLAHRLASEKLAAEKYLNDKADLLAAKMASLRSDRAPSIQDKAGGISDNIHINIYVSHYNNYILLWASIIT